jgi:chemotaxis protein CheD
MSTAPRQIVVGVGDLAISANSNDTLITYALGSCIAVIAVEPNKHIAGLLHFMLPTSTIAPAKAKAMPGMFADTGVPALFHALYAAGCRKEDLTVKVTGGGSLLRTSDIFDIGKQNVEALGPMFKRAGVVVTAWDVGGTASRTVEIHAATGVVIIRSRGNEHHL